MKTFVRDGEFKPVRFSSYVWKRIDGFILDSLKRELERERRQTSLDWERYDPPNEMSLEMEEAKGRIKLLNSNC